MIVKQTNLFSKQKKKLHTNQIQHLDQAVKDIIQNPAIGIIKKGDLKTISVHKFKVQNQEFLLAYQVMDEIIFLLVLGVHENFYRDLKRVVK